MENHYKTAIIALLCITALGGCAAMRDAQLRQNYLSQNDPPARVENLIRQGKITKGMTKAQVMASWGSPCSYCIGTRSRSSGSSWAYGNPAWPGTLSYVHFRNGYVVGWSQPGY